MSNSEDTATESPKVEDNEVASEEVIIAKDAVEDEHVKDEEKLESEKDEEKKLESEKDEGKKLESEKDEELPVTSTPKTPTPTAEMSDRVQQGGETRAATNNTTNSTTTTTKETKNGKSNKKSKKKKVAEDSESLPSNAGRFGSGIEIIRIKEKHGQFRKAVPTMPLPVAAILCLVNVVLPGIGTLISAFTVFCCGKTEYESRGRAFTTNVFAAILQILTVPIIVGWIWSIVWGVTFITAAVSNDEDKDEMSCPQHV